MHIGQSISSYQKILSCNEGRGEGCANHRNREKKLQLLKQTVRNCHCTFVRIQYCRLAPQHSGAAQYGCTWHEFNFCPLVWVKQQVCSCIDTPTLMHIVETHLEGIALQTVCWVYWNQGVRVHIDHHQYKIIVWSHRRKHPRTTCTHQVPATWNQGENSTLTANASHPSTVQNSRL